MLSQPTSTDPQTALRNHLDRMVEQNKGLVIAIGTSIFSRRAWLIGGANDEGDRSKTI